MISPPEKPTYKTLGGATRDFQQHSRHDRRTRKHHFAEEKICIVLEGLRSEDSIAELCRREGIATRLYYSCSKEFLEAGKKRLAGDTARQGTSPEVKDLRQKASALKEAVADLTLENRPLKKSMLGDGGDEE